MKYELIRQKKTYTSVIDVGPTTEVGDIVVLVKNLGRTRESYVVKRSSTTLANRCDECDVKYKSCLHYWFSCGGSCVLKKIDTVLEDL